MEISLIGKRIHVPKQVSDWLDFDRAFSAKVLAGDWHNMKEKDLIYAGIQTILAVALVGCSVLGRDLKTQETPTLVYSPSGEIVPINMFGQDTIFYTAQPAFVELGLSAKQVEVIQLEGSSQYTAVQLMEVQDGKGEIFYNLMFQGKNGQVKQEWAVLLADSPQSPESVLYQLDLVSTNGHNEFVADMARPVGNLTPTQLQINLPGETGVVPVPTADLIGLFSGAQPVLANLESTSASVATLAPTPKPTATFVFHTPTEVPTLVAVDHMPANLSPDQQATWNSAPDLTGISLTKSAFLVDNQSNFLMYTDASGHVTKVYDAEGARLDNALQVGANNFILNEGSASIIINPKRSYDSASAAISQAVDYFRLKLCANAKNKSLPAGDLSDILKSDFAKQNSSCDVTLKPTSQVWQSRYNAHKYDFSVGGQSLKISADTPVVFRIVEKPTQNMVYIIGRDENSNTTATGTSVEQNNGVIVVNIFENGSPLPQDYSDYVLSFRLNFAMRLLLDRVKKSNVFSPDRDFVLESILYNPYTFKPASPVIFAK